MLVRCAFRVSVCAVCLRDSDFWLYLRSVSFAWQPFSSNHACWNVYLYDGKASHVHCNNAYVKTEHFCSYNFHALFHDLATGWCLCWDTGILVAETQRHRRLVKSPIPEVLRFLDALVNWESCSKTCCVLNYSIFLTLVSYSCVVPIIKIMKISGEEKNLRTSTTSQLNRFKGTPSPPNELKPGFKIHAARHRAATAASLPATCRVFREQLRPQCSSST